MKVALALPSLQASPRSRALALGRRLAGTNGLVVAAGLPEASPTGAALAAKLAIKSAYFIVDAAFAAAADANPPHALAHALARLLARIRVDLILVDAAADRSGEFTASLAHHAELGVVLGVHDLGPDASRPDVVVATLDLAGRRQQLRIDLPAVISVTGETTAVAAIEPGQVRSRSFSATDLDLVPAQLIVEASPHTAVRRAVAQPIVVSAIDDLLV